MGLLILLLMLLGVVPARGQEDDNEVEVISDIPYTEGDDADSIRHTLDLYLPTGVDNPPLVVYVHGGAWVGGSKDRYGNIGNALGQAGYATAIINYRLSPRVMHPAHVQDLAAAVDWLLDNAADYCADASRLILTGHSAGGHMISLLVLDESYLDDVGREVSDIRGVLAFSGVFVIDDWIARYATGAFPEAQSLRDAASPYTLAQNLTADAAADLPPFMLLVSEYDYPELIVETGDMFAALDDAGVRAGMAVIPDREHFTLVMQIGSDGDETTEWVIAWLETALSEATATDTE
jgi:acetyl esterase/lipase